MEEKLHFPDFHDGKAFPSTFVADIAAVNISIHYNANKASNSFSHDVLFVETFGEELNRTVVVFMKFEETLLQELQNFSQSTKLFTLLIQLYIIFYFHYFLFIFHLQNFKDLLTERRFICKSFCRETNVLTSHVSLLFIANGVKQAQQQNSVRVALCLIPNDNLG